MAGFFGFFDYSKPGPGVSKDAPPKARIMIFFDVLTRKFWDLAKINFMFFLFNIPALIAVFMLSQFFWQTLIGDDPLVDLSLRLIIGTIFLCIPLVTVGPAQAGFTYVLRNYSREEHAFIWWDFKETALKNFKQSMVICLIDLVVALIVCIDINIYRQLDQSSFINTLGSMLLIVGAVIYMMMHLYMYPMLITFNLSVKKLFKNALIFAIIKLFPNLAILLLNVALILASFYFNVVVGFVLLPIITLSITGLINNFYVFPVLKKYMIDKNSVQVVEDNSQEKVFSDRNLLGAKEKSGKR